MALILGNLPSCLLRRLGPLPQGDFYFLLLTVAQYREGYSVAGAVIVGQVGNQFAVTGHLVRANGGDYVPSRREFYTINVNGGFRRAQLCLVGGATFDDVYGTSE